MKAFLSVLIIIASTSFVEAQARIYKPFKIGIITGLSVPNNSKPGYLFTMEPSYAVNDKFALSVRFEQSIVHRDLNLGDNLEARYIKSYGLGGDYYFNSNKYRFFTGLGIGLYQYANPVVNRENFKPVTSVQYDASTIGFYPRIGIELSHLRIGAEYNASLRNNTVNNRDYFAAKIGLLIGGGKYVK